LAAVAYGDMLTGDPDATVPASTDDVERLLEFQIEQMQCEFVPVMSLVHVAPSPSC
jgi:hypothetical protein